MAYRTKQENRSGHDDEEIEEEAAEPENDIRSQK